MYLDLTNKQIMILKFIKDQLNQKGYPPSVREIGTAVGLKSTSTTHSHLNKLEKLGYIKRDPTKPRAIEVLEKENFSNGFHQELIDLPVIKQNITGKPIDSKVNIEEYIPLPANLIIGKDNFILNVKDESMVNAGILKGDYVIVDKEYCKLNSNIVIALIGKDLIIRRFLKEDDYIHLEAENNYIDTIVLHKSDVDIIGVVRGNLRVIK